MADVEAPVAHPVHSDKPQRPKSRKRRQREAEGETRKHKRSKSEVAEPVASSNAEAELNRQTKSGRNDDDDATNGQARSDRTTQPDIHESKADRGPERNDRRKERREKKKKDKENTARAEQTGQDEVDPFATSAKQKKDTKSKNRASAQEEDHAVAQDSMDIDETPRAATTPAQLSDKQHPFYTQTVSQYLPLSPYGIIEPLQSYTDQHLKPILNRYVPEFHGVLLAYRHPRLGEAPGRGSLTEESEMDDTAVLESINEYAVSYGWLTFEVDLFRPSRGAWLEGVVNLQGGGHIGVVCWGKFNAAIEAQRLPKGWRWVDLLSKGDRTKGNTATDLSPAPEPGDEEEGDESQVHMAGYWIDEKGGRIKSGTKLCFRIKNYEVGVSGDYGYLSIEGTMLSEEDEENKRKDETRRKSQAQGTKRNGMRRAEQRRVPEYSMTKFGQDEAEENENQRAEIKLPSRADGDTDGA
ncbi:hypothetical protein F5Y18DRAFT_343917 [Xylariaceae sp. FL1019]|nr:hypothetical protein F5Y18DRAFT_343917 [Xylariaceae sp. FL1019]